MSTVQYRLVGLSLILAGLQFAGCASGPAVSEVPVEDRGAVVEETRELDLPRPKPRMTTAPAQEEATLEPQETPPPREPPQAAVQKSTPPQERPPAPHKPAPAVPAVVALLDTATQQETSGHVAAAAASLERALRIQPENPWTWYRLAVVRFRQGQLDQAEQLARKSDTLAGPDHDIRARSWRLIALIRERQGDRTGAEAARQRANGFGP